MMETNFFQTRFPCPKCQKLVRMNVDETYEEHLCFEDKQPWKEKVIKEWNRREDSVFESRKETIDFISQLLKEEQCCFCKDKGVIELIEEAVEAERARIWGGTQKLKQEWDANGKYEKLAEMIDDGIELKKGFEAYNRALSDALQVINKDNMSCECDKKIIYIGSLGDNQYKKCNLCGKSFLDKLHETLDQVINKEGDKSD